MKQGLSIVFALILIAGVGYGIFIGGKELIELIKTTDSKLGAAIITAAATILVGISVAVYSQNRIKTRELQEAHRESKIELYNKFINKLVEVMAGTIENASGIEPSERDLIDFMIEYKRDLILRASPGVIKAHIEYEIESTNSTGSKNVLKKVDNLILEMRKDIGLGNSGLNNFETIQIFLKDKAQINELK